MYIINSSIQSSRWLTVLTKVIFGVLLSTSACTGYVREDRTLRNDISTEDNAAEFLSGQVAIYDLGIAEEYSDYFGPSKLAGQVRFVSDEEPENVGGAIHYYALDPLDKKSQELWDRNGWKSGWLWLGAGGIALAKVIKLVVPRTGSDHFLMICTVEIGVPIKNLGVYGGRLLSYLESKFGKKLEQAAAKEVEVAVEAGIQNWVEKQIESGAEKKVVPLLLSGGKPGAVIANALEKHEAKFAEEIVAHRGGELVGALNKSQPGIDGFLEGIPISLKETAGGLVAVLKHASVAESQALNAGYKGVELFVKAPNVGQKELLDFVQKGPLSKIPGQGIISAINVLTRDGWVRVIR